MGVCDWSRWGRGRSPPGGLRRGLLPGVVLGGLSYNLSSGTHEGTESPGPCDRKSAWTGKCLSTVDIGSTIPRVPGFTDPNTSWCLKQQDILTGRDLWVQQWECGDGASGVSEYLVRGLCFPRKGIFPLQGFFLTGTNWSFSLPSPSLLPRLHFVHGLSQILLWSSPFLVHFSAF